jgi:peptidoglycan hydrolase CwlO-like protein
MDPKVVESIDYQTTNSVEILRMKIEDLVKEVTSLKRENEKLLIEVDELNRDIRILEKSVYYD